MNIGTVIREMREAQHATLEDVAFAAKTTASNLSRIELGRHGCSPKMLERVAVALGVSVADLYLRVENTEPHNSELTATDLRLRCDRNYDALSAGNKEIVDEFIKMLLKRQLKDN